MKIYTRTGDDGTTGLFSGERVSKAHLRVEVYGTVDELNSAIGLARAMRPGSAIDALLQQVQNLLFKLSADFAATAPRAGIRIEDEDTTWLETEIDRMTAALPPLRHFILPGGTPPAAQIHIARTICRRAERLAVHLAESEPLRRAALIHLNRLSDFLFTLARFENHLNGMEEVKWPPTRMEPGGSP